MNFKLAIALLAPFTIWSATFLLLYATQTTGCALGWHRSEISGLSLLRIILIAMVIALTILVAWSGFLASGFAQRTSEAGNVIAAIVRYTAIAAAVSTPFVFAGVLVLELC